MKTRESGMPEEPLWESFFDPRDVLAKLMLPPEAGDVTDFGCGYGTFTIAAARVTAGTVHAFDIDPAMTQATARKAATAGLANVRVEQRDFVAEGTGLPDASIGYVMLFNILHCEQPDTLLRETWRILRDDGRLAIMHWNRDPSTPRGPSMDIRPSPAQCRAWAEAVGVRLHGPASIDLPPYHYGLVLSR